MRKGKLQLGELGRRQEAERPPVLRFADLSLDTGERRAHRSDRPIDLTTTEYELLRQFMEHPRRVLPRELLMDRVWGYESAVDTGTVTVHVRRLREKIEDDPSRPTRLETVWGVGYRLVP